MLRAAMLGDAPHQAFRRYFRGWFAPVHRRPEQPILLHMELSLL
jgi:hypothetical protein